MIHLCLSNRFEQNKWKSSPNNTYMYDTHNDYDRLVNAAEAVGVSKSLLNVDSLNGLYYFKLWGEPLDFARTKFTLVSTATFEKELALICGVIKS